MLIAPYDGDVVKGDADGLKGQGPAEDVTGKQGSGTTMPDVPGGLMLLYTQKAVVLTWDEVKGQDVRRYKVYRSSGDGYLFLGDTATPAFTDREVNPDTKYHYKVTAVGILESLPSKEIVIITEVR